VLLLGKRRTVKKPKATFHGRLVLHPAQNDLPQDRDPQDRDPQEGERSNGTPGGRFEVVKPASFKFEIRESGGLSGGKIEFKRNSLTLDEAIWLTEEINSEAGRQNAYELWLDTETRVYPAPDSPPSKS
jgi:hypothetical protein